MPAASADAVDRLGDVGDGMAEDFLALHAQMAGRAGSRTARHRHRACRAAGRRRIDLGVEHAAVGIVALALVGLQHDRAGAVAEQHAGAAVVPVEDARHGLGADHQHGLGLAGADEVVGDRQADR